MEISNQTTIHDIPNEILVHTFQYLSVVDLFRTREVSSHWNSLFITFSQTSFFGGRIAEIFNRLIWPKPEALTKAEEGLLSHWGNRVKVLQIRATSDTTHFHNKTLFTAIHYLSELEELIVYNRNFRVFLFDDRHPLPPIPKLKKLTIYNYPALHRLHEVIIPTSFPHLNSIELRPDYGGNEYSYREVIRAYDHYLSLEMLPQVSHLRLNDRDENYLFSKASKIFFTPNQLVSISFPITAFKLRVSKINPIDFLNRLALNALNSPKLKHVQVVYEFKKEHYLNEGEYTYIYFMNQVAKIFEEQYGIDSWEIVSGSGKLMHNWSRS
ncbi:MAG: hypothetical protein K940chlam3_00348 [Chlamydiae bacterium]|nr:hypothetical protein [Chlamydiota bacterium]